MKNKGATILLLIAVAAIWGILGYKIYNTVHSNNQYTKPKIDSSSITATDTTAGSYTLHEYNRDPFLSILKDTAVYNAPVDTLKTIKQPVVIHATILPDYCGTIANNKKKLAIMKMSGKYIFMAVGDTIRSLKLKQIQATYVVMNDNGKNVTIALNNVKPKNVVQKK